MTEQMTYYILQVLENAGFVFSLVGTLVTILSSVVAVTSYLTNDNKLDDKLFSALKKALTISAILVVLGMMLQPNLTLIFLGKF